MNVNKIDMNFSDVFKNLFFPARCDVCGSFVDNEGLCADCWSKVSWISEPKCKICGDPFIIPIEENEAICAQCLAQKPYFDKAVAAFFYDDFSKDIILKFKYEDATYLSKKLSRLLYKVVALEIAKADVIIPVPVYFLKRLERKYNQTELLASELSHLSSVKYEPRVLKKIKQTTPQEGLSRAARRKNVIGSFGIDEKFKDSVKNKCVVLVDDVFTTGTTVNECSKVLKKNGAEEVIVVTLAKVIMEK